MNELDAIRARRAAITPGVWGTKTADVGAAVDELQIVSIAGRGEMHIATVGDADIAEVITDAAFIAAAPADVDTLLAMVERLTGERDALNMWCDEWKRRADELAGELAAERDAAKRHAAYIASCVDECGSYRP